MSAPRSLLARASVADLEPLEAILGDEYSDEWRNIATVLYLELRASPGMTALGDTRLASLAVQLSEGLCDELGGTQPYLSKGQRHKLSRRDRQILEESNGRNHDELARKYGLTPRQMYNILQRQLRIERARRQGTLPLDD